MKKVIVIVGPTASGKTALSISMAQAFQGEIINGDSVAIYRKLDIGSAKIKEDEKQGIPHHLIDLRDPSDPYSVYQFQKDVRKLIDVIERPIIVGGTGLYIKAALYDYDFTENERSDAFDRHYESYSNEALYQELIEKDPAITIDQHNRRRLLRALEQAQSGHLRSSKTNKDRCLYDCLVLYLNLDRDVLEQRLKCRLEEQMKLGFIDEVKALDQQGIVVNAIGYREIHEYIHGQMSYQETFDAIIKASKRLAKKQKTFFKNQMTPLFLDATDPDLIQKAKEAIHLFLEDPA